MAQVPNYGGHQVMPSIFGYKPVSTDIPQVPELGIQKALAGASNKFDELYLKFLAEQDDARVTEAITDLRRKAIDMETGEGGWASTLGANALESDMDGKGLVERMDEGLQDYGTKFRQGSRLVSRRCSARRRRRSIPRPTRGSLSTSTNRRSCRRRRCMKVPLRRPWSREQRTL